MIVPNKIIVHRGDKRLTAIELSLGIELVIKELYFGDANMVSAHADWTKVPPGNAIEVVPVV